MPGRSKHSKFSEAALLAESEMWEDPCHVSAEHNVEASKDEEQEIEKATGLQMISIRLPGNMVEQLKRRAKDAGVKYQPYVRQLLMEQLNKPTLEKRVEVLEMAEAQRRRRLTRAVLYYGGP